ncbi:hypothetical protein MP228_011351 [Amoeboaphelidium protococcarum]|nr:hypothetical protein MP228_011351 [Amoeboaphelidium protococcarum]
MEEDIVTNKSFFLYGFNSVKFDELSQLVLSLGGKVCDTVSANTDYFITTPYQAKNTFGSAEINMAIQLGIPILSDLFFAIRYPLLVAQSSSSNEQTPSIGSSNSGVKQDDLLNASTLEQQYLSQPGHSTQSKQLELGSNSKIKSRSSSTVSITTSQPDYDGFMQKINENGAHEFQLGNLPRVNKDIDVKDQAIRSQWQKLLTTYITGDEFYSEKLKFHDQETKRYSREIWLGVYGVASGIVDIASVNKHQLVERHVDMQLIDGAKQLKQFLQADLSGDSFGECCAKVDSALSRHDRLAALFPSLDEFYTHFSTSIIDDQYLRRLAALRTYSNIYHQLIQLRDIIFSWAQIDDLDVVEAESCVLSKLLKEHGVQKIFEFNLLSKLPSQITKCFNDQAPYMAYYEQCKMPLLRPLMRSLFCFPVQVMKGCLKMRLENGQNILHWHFDSSKLMLVDQLLEDFKNKLSVGVSLRQKIISELTNMDKENTVIDAEFDSYMKETLIQYLHLMDRKFQISKSQAWFRDSDSLDIEWQFLRSLQSSIVDSDLLIAQCLSRLIGRLVAGIMSYFSNVLNPPKQMLDNEKQLIKWFSRVLDNIRVKSRRILQFSKALVMDLENSIDLQLDSEQIPQLVTLLQSQQYVLCEVPSAQFIILASPQLLAKDSGINLSIQEMLEPKFWGKTYNDKPQGHLLIVKKYDCFIWNGEKVKLSLKVPAVDLNEHFVIKLVSSHGFTLSQEWEKFVNFMQGNQDSTLKVDLSKIDDKKSISADINKNLKQFRGLLCKFALQLLNSVNTIRQLTGSIQCVDLIEDCFTFVSDFGYRSMGFMTDSSVTCNLHKELTAFAIEWVSFTCSDCSPIDKRTFRWALLALEFVMMITKGDRIYDLSVQQFTTLRSKVACCMTLLISHFDQTHEGQLSGDTTQDMENAVIIDGVDMSLFADQDEDYAPQQATKTPEVELQIDGQTLAGNSTRLLKIEEIESSLQRKQVERRVAGKVLDQNVLQEQGLTELLAATSMNLKWQQGKYLGSGAFGSVYAALNLESGDMMAVKEIKLLDQGNMKKLVRSVIDEMSVLQNLRHPNIIEYYGAEVHRDKVFIFMEFCSGGSLFNMLESGRIEEEKVLQLYTYELLQGLQYLHQHNIIHRDIKPDNVLIDHHGVLKLVDFGGAKQLVDRNSIQTSKKKQASLTGTPQYLAPEVVTGKNAGAKLGAQDIWSLGCVLLEMATGKRPWSHLDNEWAIMYQIGIGGNHPAVDSSLVSKLCYDFLMSCFLRADQRPSSSDLLNHEFLNDTAAKVTEHRKKQPASLYPNPWTSFGFVNGLHSPGYSPSLYGKSSYFSSMRSSMSQNSYMNNF